MTTINAQLKDMSENEVMPKTDASLVFNGSGASAYNLGDVEAGAEVNIIEDIKVNGTSLSVSSKEVNVQIPAHVAYSMESTSADTGYLSAFQLTGDGSSVSGSVKINIPKDMVLSSGTVEECTTAGYVGGDSSTGTAVSGAQVGEKYMHLVLANADQSDIFVNVSDLIDTYTAGTGISISNNQIAIDTSVVAQLGDELSDYGIEDCYTQDEMDEAFGDLTYEELT